jgi:hypothetical protein
MAYLSRADLCTTDPRAVFGSRAMVELVFPSAFRLLKLDLGVDLAGVLWPDWAVVSCPELRASLSWGGTEFVVRNPTLLPVQMAGFIIGIVGALVLAGRRCPARLRDDALRLEAWSYSLCWSLALAWFAAMNATSILAHAVFEPKTASHEFWLASDVVATCLSSCNLILGALTALLRINAAEAFVVGFNISLTVRR